MRRIAIVCLLLLIPLPVGAQAATDVVLSELLPDPDGGREFVELRNDGNAAIDLTGWQIADDVGNTFTFPAWTLHPGAHVVVWGGGEATPAGPAWSKSAVWNNGGDEATLRDATGAVIDSFAYGSHANATVDAETGKSLNRGEPWTLGIPTPGSAPEASEATLSATVENVPPALSDLVVPERLHRSEPWTLTFTLDDDNGDDLTWNVTDATGTLAAGNTTGMLSVPMAASPAAGPWTLTISATDGTASTAATRTITVAASDLEVDVPATLAFEPMAPGETNVSTVAAFNVSNAGQTPITPYIDVSDFTGPGTISVTNNIRIGWTEGNATTWTLYDGPLTALPELAPGETRAVTLQIINVPKPLAAGTYGTTFSLTG